MHLSESGLVFLVFLVFLAFSGLFWPFLAFSGRVWLPSLLWSFRVFPDLFGYFEILEIILITIRITSKKSDTTVI